MNDERSTPAAHDSRETARRAREGHAALWIVQICFGLFPIFGKWAFVPGAFTPRSVGAWRMTFAGAVLGALAFALHGRRAVPRARDLPHLVVCSLLGVTLNMVLYLEGLARTSATHATLVMCLIPVFTFVIAALSGQEVLRASRAAGVLIALAGALMLVWSQGREASSARLGTLLMVLNTLAYASYLVLSRPLTRRYPPLVVIAWVFLLSVPCVPLFARMDAWWPEGASTRAWVSLAFILVFPTVVAYLLNVFALSRLRASTTAVYIYAQPIITGTAAAILLHERPGPSTFVAAIAIFAGIALVARRPAPIEAAPAGSGS